MVKLDSVRLFVGTGRVVDLFECVVDVGVAEEAAGYGTVAVLVVLDCGYAHVVSDGWNDTGQWNNR